MAIKIQTDEHGNAILLPMTGYEIGTVAGMSLMVVIEYAETREQFKSGERKTLQAILYADQALEFAEELRWRAAMLLAPNSGNKVQ